jgi:hypothetical protein
LEALENRNLLSTSIPLSSSTWTAIGPGPIQKGFVGGGELYQPYSGRVNAIAPDPADSNVIYIAASGGGVWKTTDAGASWKPLTDSQPTLFMGSIAIASSNPSIIFAGTGEADNGDFYGRGILKSSDAGNTWTLLGNSVFNRHGIIKIVIDPSNPDIVYAAMGDTSTNGLPGNHGIWKSTNGGVDWTNITENSGFVDQAFTDLVMDPSNSQHLFAAGAWRDGYVGNGLYETFNGGTSWTLSTGGGTFPTGIMDGRITLTISPSSPQTLYASIADPVTFGLFALLKTTNGGASWTDLTAKVPNYVGSQGDFDMSLIVDPSNPNIVYVGGEGDFSPGPAFRPINIVIKSTDGGNSWVDISVGDNPFVGPHFDQHGFAFDANGRLLDGNDGGIWRLDNPTPGSIAWSNINGNLQITQFNGIALDPTDLNIAYGGSQDNGTAKFTDSLGWNQIKDGDGGFIRVEPNHPQTIYHTFYYLAGDPGQFHFIQRSDDGGATWTDITTGIDTNEAGSFNIPYEMDPTNPNRLILGTTRLYETLDRGDHWQAISTPAANPVSSFAIAPSNPATIYVAVGDLIGVTFDDSQTIQEIDLPTGSGPISDLQVDPLNNMVAYALRGNFGNGHIFRTANGGTTWTDISGNLPDLPANTLAVAPGSTALFVGNDTGVWVTYDLGANWSPYGAGLPHAQVVQLELSAKLNVLAAGTYGRGMWEIAVPLSAQVNSLVNVVEGQSLINTTVAIFTDPLGNESVAKYSATINWGDGATSPGTVQANSSGGFDVLGSHTYGEEGSFTLSVSLTDLDASSGSASSPVTVGDVALAAIGVSFSGTEGATFTGQVTSFNDGDLGAPLSDFTSGSGGALIDWGDGATTAAVISQPGGIGTAFIVSGSHTYLEDGSYLLQITVTDKGGSTASAGPAAAIADAGLTVTEGAIQAIKGVAFSGQVATFADASPTSPISDFTTGFGGATIDWGDGSSSPGTITQPGGIGTLFVVTGNHTYNLVLTGFIHVTIRDKGGSVASAVGTTKVYARDSVTGRVSVNGQWWTGISTGSSFSTSLWTTWSPAVTWVDLLTGDFNHDGLTDLAGRILQNGQWWVAMSNGAGFTTSLWTTWSTIPNWVDVKVGDFDGDGKDDIIARYSQIGQWWLASSTGSSFTNYLAANWNPAATWVDVRAGDLNGDGKEDITGRYLQGSSWWTAISSGSTLATSQWAMWTPRANWVDVQMGDFNGDGKADIAGRYLQGGSWWIGLSTGSSFTTTLWTTWSTAVTWVDVNIGDFNGDGQKDILGRFSQTGQWWVGLSTGSSFTNALWTTWNPAAMWMDVKVGDFNGDGLADITGRVLSAGQWWTGLSTGSSFSNSLWASWSPKVNWGDVRTAEFT